MDTQAPRSVLQLTVSAGPAAVKGGIVNLLTEAIAPDLLAPPVIPKEMVKGKPHRHAAEHRRGCRKGDLHCLSAASLQSPGSIEEHRVSRLRRDKWRGALFLFLLLGKQKKKGHHHLRQKTNHSTISSPGSSQTQRSPLPHSPISTMLPKQEYTIATQPQTAMIPLPPPPGEKNETVCNPPGRPLALLRM